jgi:pimeloyl-ACP methyl ester carboxylesterase
MMGIVPRLSVLPFVLCLSCSPGTSVRVAFTEAACAFAPAKGASVRCGWLTVPENRNRPDGRAIRLHVAVYRSRAGKPAPDPIVWLVGGPGGRAHRLASALFSRVVEPFLGRRDFIVLDVRGTGYSDPALDCKDRSGEPARWLPACRERLSAIADLSCYNSAAVAEDLADLRRALGLKEWNLLGESYGTRLALIALRDRPEGIRSVILDSVVPPEVDEYALGSANFENALSALFADCAEDLACNAAFPNLRERMLRTADRLDAEPWRLTGKWEGAPYDARLDGRGLLQALRMALYESDLIPAVPKAIYRAQDRSDDSFWRRAVGTEAVISGALVDLGAHFSYHCSEEVPFTDTVRMREEDARRPWLRHTLFAGGIRSVCGLWLPEGGGARESQPVKSDVPALLLAGEYDPASPPAYAESAASHLKNGHLFVFPAMGHWLTANPVSSCPQNVALEFLDNPRRRPEAPCLSRLNVRWEI